MIVRKKYEHGGYHEPPDGFTLEDYIRQMYAESRFNPKAGSPVGAAGLAQIMPSTRKYMIGRYNLPETVDVYNPQDARTMQRKYMEDLYGRDWNTGTDENKKLKALAAYNYGPTNVIRALEKAKKRGYDIYDDTSWTKDPKVLPKETRDYLDRTYFATDEAFEREYSSARPKYFDLFPDDVEQKQETVEAPEPIQKIDPKLQDALEMIPHQPAVDPQLKQAFKIMGFKGYKDGGVTVKKYEHGGSHPTKEEVRQRMLDSGRFEEGPSGELLRVPQQDMFGFPTTERARELSTSTEPLNEQQLREFISYGFSPTNPVNTAFSMAAGASPAGQAVDVLGNAIGRGLGYVAKGGKQVMNFLRPKADEITDAATAGFGQIRNEPELRKIELARADQMREGLEETNVAMRERLDDYFSEEGQRRAKDQLVDQVKYYDELSNASDEYLAKLGFQPQDISVLRKHMQKFRNAAGDIDPDSPAIEMTLQSQNQSMRGLVNESEGVVRRADMDDKTATAMRELRKRRDAAIDAADYQKVADLEDLMDQTEQAFLTRSALVLNDMRNAFYQGKPSATSVLPANIKMNREYLLDPASARVATVHEMQHAVSDIPTDAFPATTQIRVPRTVEADRILDDLVLIDKNNRAIKTPDSDPVWSDLSYFIRDKTGRLSEKSPFLSEMREDMLKKGFISDRYEVVDDALIDRYLKQYYSRRDVSRPTTDYNTGTIRILEIMDPNTGAYNRGVLKDALNKMLVAVPAVGAAGVAAGTSAEDGSSYYKGGKLKLKKAKSYGIGVRKK